MKKILIVSLFVLITTLSFQTTKASEYLSYQDVTFEHDSVKFLDNYSRQDFEDAYEFVERVFWGWDLHIKYRKEGVTFTKETLYVIENNGTSPISQNFKLKQEEIVKRQYDVSGSIGLKGSGKDTKFSGSFDQKIQNSISKTTSTSMLEEFNIKVDVDPGTKLYVEILGEATITNGVGKYFVFGRSIKKGGFEVFTVTTEYYSLRKEMIDEA